MKCSSSSSFGSYLDLTNDIDPLDSNKNNISQNINTNTLREQNVSTDVRGIGNVRGKQPVQNIINPCHPLTQCGTSADLVNRNMYSRHHLLHKEIYSFLSCYGVAVVVKNGGSTVRDSVSMDDSAVLER